MVKKYFTFVAWVLVVAFPSATLMAENRGAMVYTSGDVSVNGSKVGRSVSVFKGDTVQTASNSQVTMALNGSTVSLPANSGIRYTDNEVINIGCGAAAVKTTNGLTSKVGAFTIQPSSRDANYDVVSTGKELKIAARQGDLSLRAGGKSVTVPAGKMATLPANCALVAQDTGAAGATANQTGTTGNQTGTTTTPTTTSAPSSSGMSSSSSSMGSDSFSGLKFALIGGAAVGATVGVGLYETRDRSARSPARP